MSIIAFESPLQWPEGVSVTPRASQRNDHGFPSPLSLNDALDYLSSELQDLGAQRVTLTTDIEHLGSERLRKKIGARTGACLQIKNNGRQFALPCDRWQSIEHNIYAIHLALRQFHAIERWGIGNCAVLLSGFELDRRRDRTRTTDTSDGEWMAAMGLGPTATLEDAVAIYRRRAKQNAQNNDELARLNDLMDKARHHFAKSS